ncbi:hypothetical protein Poli38472_007917 [Pythium oligandrum]|uniref:Transmembrane protein n=1 Tax=Pythium oligandrum TaxID=41045 RepID=A0A8K1CL54_PYTOL|nr:hypothetical protein Poli38472_007917 [Pythium oligandrum]|eukprot:TMW65275.1 hypothetical protein Poli38472_007917 [Pythium oligandrum]
MADNTEKTPVKEETAVVAVPEPAKEEPQATAVEIVTEPEVDSLKEADETDNRKLTKQQSSINEEVAALMAALRANRTFAEEQEENGAQLFGGGLAMIATGLVLALFLIIPIFWCLRVDNQVSWNWAVVFIPMWIVDVVVYCGLFCSIGVVDEASLQHSNPRLYKLFSFLKAVLLLVTQVFIAQKLNGDIDWSVVRVLVPYFVLDGLNILDAVYGIVTKRNGHASLEQPVFRFVQVLLIGLQIDGKLGEASWWVVFTPLWVMIGLGVASILVSAAMTRFVVPLFANNPVLFATLQKATSKYFVFLLLVIAALLSPYFVLAARVENGSFSVVLHSFAALCPRRWTRCGWHCRFCLGHPK